MDAENRFTPPYASFTTINNLLDNLGGGALPPRLDKRYLDNYSGATQSVLMSTFRTFNLIDDGGNISDALAKMATDMDFRKREWRTILDRFYTKQMQLAEQNATAQQLLESFGDQGITGSTLRKAVVFYLAIVEYVGAPKSPHFKAPKQPKGTTRPRKITSEEPNSSDTPESTVQPGQSLGVVKLNSGGLVTLSITADLFQLSGEDRGFVFELIDTLRGYEQDGEDLEDEIEVTQIAKGEEPEDES